MDDFLIIKGEKIIPIPFAYILLLVFGLVPTPPPWCFIVTWIEYQKIAFKLFFTLLSLNGCPFGLLKTE